MTAATTKCLRYLPTSSIEYQGIGKLSSKIQSMISIRLKTKFMKGKYKKASEVARVRLYSKTEMFIKVNSREVSAMVQDFVNLHPLGQSTRESGVKISQWELDFYSHCQTS